MVRTLIVERSTCTKLGGFILLTVSGADTWFKGIIHHFDLTQNFRDIHRWADDLLFTRWERASNKTQILFIASDAPSVQRIIADILCNIRKGLPNDPLWPYIMVLDDYLNIQHEATMVICHLAELEEGRAEHPRQLKPETDYARLHKIARHAGTLVELLDVNVMTVDYMVRYHNDFMKKCPGSETDVTLRMHHEQFIDFTAFIYGIRCRCVSYKDRIRNEIQLAFNIVSQDDARASVAIAKATKSDSQAMKAISFIALVFLPPTYIAAVFSTTFFQFGTDSKSWEVSEKVWVYWAFVIPVTLASVMLWYTRILRDR